MQITVIHCFANIGKDLANKIKYDCNKKYSYYLTGNSEIRFQFQEINEESILKIFDNFPAKSSSGCDGITSLDLDPVTQRNTPFWKLSAEQ